MAAVVPKRSARRDLSGGSAAVGPLRSTQGIAAAIDRCTLLTTGEAAAVLRGPVGPGHAAGPMRTACPGDGPTDEAACVQVQVIEGHSDWSPATLADGYAELGGVGD